MDKVLCFKRQPPEEETGSTIFYLLLSYLSGLLEIGVFTGGLMQFGLSTGLAFALAYQVGCLMRNPLRLSLRGSACILCCSLPLLMLSFGSIWVLLIVSVLVSAGVQSAREWLLPVMNIVSLSTKRIVRVAGFICGIVGGFSVGLSLIACVSIAACLIVLPIAIKPLHRVPWMSMNKQVTPDTYGWIMLTHQIHYFVYAYIILAILLTDAGQHPAEHILWQTVKASGWFALGWFSYISGQWLLEEKLKLSAFQAAIAGHAWVASCLVCMALFHTHQLVLGLSWVLGGFGGGSVYAIKDLAKVNACRADIELWEHLGHVAGVFLSLTSIIIYPHDPALPFFMAFAAALVTLFLLKRSAAERV